MFLFRVFTIVMLSWNLPFCDTKSRLMFWLQINQKWQLLKGRQLIISNVLSTGSVVILRILFPDNQSSFAHYYIDPQINIMFAPEVDQILGVCFYVLRIGLFFFTVATSHVSNCWHSTLDGATLCNKITAWGGRRFECCSRNKLHHAEKAQKESILC